MWCTQLCIDQFLSLHSLVFQPHDILGHMICVCSIKIYSSRILPKKLIQVKMPQRDSLDSDLQTFCNFSTTESSLSSQTLVQWGVSCYSSVEQVHLIDALWGRRCLGRMACFGTLFWGLGQALLIWDLCKIATWPSKERQKLKKKKMLHLAVQMTILPLGPQERRKMSPKAQEIPENCHNMHMLLDHTYKPWGLGWQHPLSISHSDHTTFFPHNNISVASYEVNIDSMQGITLL